MLKVPTTSTKLAKLLVAPSKIATSLNWRKSNGAILSLDIHKDRIGIAIAGHPTIETSAQTLEAIPICFEGGKLPQHTTLQIEDIIAEYNILGIIVSWPVQKDTGHMGAACGRTIRILEDLLENSNVNRPFCLWDSEHPQLSGKDKWGRCADYNRISNKETHLASIEQYQQDENVVAAMVWDDFVKTHWPTIHGQKEAYISCKS